MTDKEYRYNLDLLTLLRNIVIMNTGFGNMTSVYLESCIDNLEDILFDIKLEKLNERK